MKRLHAYQSHIEDTKGNNGEQGHLSMTNLRLMWVSDRSHRTNLCVGYSCIVSINIREAATRLRGTALTLHILLLPVCIATNFSLNTEHSSGFTVYLEYNMYADLACIVRRSCSAEYARRDQSAMCKAHAMLKAPQRQQLMQYHGHQQRASLVQDQAACNVCTAAAVV